MLKYSFSVQFHPFITNIAYNQIINHLSTDLNSSEVELKRCYFSISMKYCRRKIHSHFTLIKEPAPSDTSECHLKLNTENSTKFIKRQKGKPPTTTNYYSVNVCSKIITITLFFKEN